MTKLTIKYKKTADLVPYANNSRLHDETQLGQLVASINEFGFTNPVLLDGANGIIAGHGRVMAANVLGLETVPTIELQHLTDEQKAAYVIADNKLAQNAKWDDEILRLELQSLSDADYDLSILGFDEASLSRLLDVAETADAFEEYNEAIEYENKNANPYKSLIVHFENEQDVDNFKHLIKQNFSNSAKYIYHPLQVRKETESKRYV
jgi:hypothetical protein